MLDLLRVVVSHRDAQSGARIKYRTDSDKQPELESATFLVDGAEKEIDPAAFYTVISIDYLLNVTGGDYAAVLKQASNTRPLGLTIRDAITDYVKAETAAGREIKSTLDGRFVFDKAHPEQRRNRSYDHQAQFSAKLHWPVGSRHVAAVRVAVILNARVVGDQCAASGSIGRAKR